VFTLCHDKVHHDAKAPNCTEIGWNAYDTCSRCEYTTYVEIAAKGHSYADRVCINCGEDQPLSYGDANGDGEVNGKDVIVLRRHLVNPVVEISDGADANGDGEINGKDVIILRRYLVGTAELGPAS
jgi:hypothetical protein